MIDLERKQYVFDLLGYKPHSADQQAIHDSQSRYRILCCGRRYGKTTFGAREMTAALMDPTQAGYYWIVGPNYVQGEKEFRIVYNDIVKKLGMGSKIKRQYNIAQGLMSISMPWDSHLLVKSADRQDSLLGEGLKGVIMAEAARHSSVTWTQYVRPTLGDEKGWAIFTSTPKGYNWFEGLFMMGQSHDLHPAYESWRLPSWDNTHVYPGGRNDPEILEMEAELPKMYFEQEIAAEFTSFMGKIYDEFDPKIHVKKIEYNPRWSNWLAWDYGWQNPTVVLDIMIDPEDNVYVWREYFKSHVATWDHAHIIRDRANPPGYHIDGMIGDPRGPDQAATIALVLGPVLSDDVGWDIGIEYVKRWMKIQPNGYPKLFIDPSCETLIRQLQMLRPPDDRDGHNSREGQHKFDDHGPDALRYFFGQYFVLGAGSHLSDLYPPGRRGTEGQTFFQQETNFKRDGSMVF